MTLNQDNPTEILKEDNTSLFIIALITPKAQLFWDGNKYGQEIEGSNGFLDLKAFNRNIALAEFNKALENVKKNADNYTEANLKLIGVSPFK